MNRSVGIFWVVALVGACAACESGGGGSRGGAGGGGPTVASAPAPAMAPANPTARPRVVAGRIEDAAGRTLNLRGLNAGYAPKVAPYRAWQEEADFARMRRDGFNAFRLGVAWKAIEPAPLAYDAAFLDDVARKLDAAWAHGVHVLVDMHQDQYGEAVGGNGAPDWAVIGAAGATGGTGASGGGSGMPWWLGYAKPDVMRAFDAFWADARVPASGLGLQEHHARAVAALATRLRGHPALLGYDLMNEPFYGSDILDVLAAAIRHDPALVAGGGLAALMGGGPASAVNAFRDDAVLYGFLAGLEPPVERFERTKLQPFYDLAARAVRAADPHALLFIEGTTLKILGGRSFIRAPRGLDGRAMEGVVFAHHHYDPTMFDGTLAYDGRRTRAETAFRRSLDEARAEGAALVIGEWGALKPGLGRSADYIADSNDLFLELGIGGFYWADERDLATQSFYGAFARPHPQAVAGAPVAVSFDAQAGRLALSFIADPGTGGETVIYLPAALFSTWSVASSQPAGEFRATLDAATRTLRYETARAGPVTVEVSR